jgi:hypothetical protein
MKELLFVSAQPDVLYFHWQTELYVNNFISKGINPKNIHVIFGLPEGKEELSERAFLLKSTGVNVHHFKDDRILKHYIPSIKPYLIKKWLEKNPEHGKLFFLHDSDIVFRELPNFDDLVDDEDNYVSDTKGYIGLNYIKSCEQKYRNKYPQLNETPIIDLMSEIVGINKFILEQNDQHVGGAQYLLKNQEVDIWNKIYHDSNKLYFKLLEFQKNHPLDDGHLQVWTAEMWSLLWNQWLYGYRTKVSDSLSFSWASDNVEKYGQKNILHMAGVTEDMKDRKFYKGEFIEEDPIEKLRSNKNYFDYIDNQSSTIKYVDIIRSYIKK